MTRSKKFEDFRERKRRNVEYGRNKKYYRHYADSKSRSPSKKLN